jgi:probable addiction module antidote protein
MNKDPFPRLDAAALPQDASSIARYLSAALEHEDPDVFIAVLGDLARSHGITQIAKRAGVGRESLYKTLATGSKPRYETIRKLLDTLGVKLVVAPAGPGTADSA